MGIPERSFNMPTTWPFFCPVWHKYTSNGSLVSVQDANPALPAWGSHLFSLRSPP